MPNPLGSKLRSKTFLPTSKTERVMKSETPGRAGRLLAAGLAQGTTGTWADEL